MSQRSKVILSELTASAVPIVAHSTIDCRRMQSTIHLSVGNVNVNAPGLIASV